VDLLNRFKLKIDNCIIKSDYTGTAKLRYLKMALFMLYFFFGYVGYIILIKVLRKRKRRKQLEKLKSKRRHYLQMHLSEAVIITNEVLLAYSDVITQQELAAYKIIQNGQALDFLEKYTQFEVQINYTLARIDQFPYTQRASVLANCQSGLQEIACKRAFLMEEVLGFKLN
jgi:hypothetical protein